MNLHLFIFVSAILTISEGFTVKGSSGPLVVPLGGLVLLPCSVDKLLSVEDLEVDWRRSDTQSLISLYQNGNAESFNDRAHFFSDDIKHGNFSLLLKNVRAEDEGRYTCTVHSGHESGETEVEIKHVERLIVFGSDESISANVGEDVTLSCSVDSHIPPEDIEEVSWNKRIDNDYIKVLIYENNEVYPEASDERFRDRVEFFSAEIPRGNFSLRLKSVRTEDKGVYMCQVFAGGLSDNTTVVLGQMGFSSLHIMVLVLCISACGSALLFFSLIYCRSHSTGFRVEGSSNDRSGCSVVLPCFIYPDLMTEGLKIKWRRSGLKSPVCVYENKADKADKADKDKADKDDEDDKDKEGSEVQQHEDYQDRAHFYTEDIKHGNFSLLLKNVTLKDVGEYTCTVNSKQRSGFSFSVNLKKQYVSSDDFFTVVYSCDLVVPLGSSVVLPCLNKECLEEEIKKVEWKRSDLESPVFVYENGAEVQLHEDYQDRAHFFTKDIKHGNFSLLLKNLREEDKGEYTCKVYRHQGSMFSSSTNLEPRLLDSDFHLQMCLAFCPNVIMFFAFVFWGFSEGSVSETVCCCALYILRPLLLLWTAPYMNDFRDRNKILMQKYSYVAEYFVLTVVVYSALFTNTLQILLNLAEFDRVLIIILYVLMFVCCSCKAVYILAADVGNRSGKIIKIFDIIADLTFEFLPTLQFIILFYIFATKGGGIIIVAILPVLLTLTNERMFYKCYRHFRWSHDLVRTVMLSVALVMNAVMIGFYILTLENKTDPVGWACVVVLLQILWAVVRFTDQSSYWFSIDLGFHRFVSLFVFGSVGVVLISAGFLILELTLKTINGERAVMDLRFILFPSECFFLLAVIISGQLSSKIQACLKSCQTRMKSKRSQQNQNQQSEQQQDQVRVELLDQS